MDEVLVERVLRAVEQVPAGRVVSYGDLGALVGTGPRHVGRILREWGSGVPWWRVTRRDGTVYAALLARAREHWHQEGIALAASGTGCRFQSHHADLEQLARDYGRATADLPAPAGPDTAG
ncbi:MGMT family protein [Ornithinimicrobium sufpigmenti]|uniref:MGMT family protein n=1 Tax=Ornithinimicrobium sufpigmenti TaxID=2508882 RepID=UPI0010362C34|nr:MULTISPECIES: MGMT family protein [unclassified Ornithinimicrobium]